MNHHARTAAAIARRIARLGIEAIETRRHLESYRAADRERLACRRQLAEARTDGERAAALTAIGEAETRRATALRAAEAAQREIGT